MPQLLDSSEDEVESTVGAWLQATLGQGPTSVRIQSGYADRRVLSHLCARLSGLDVELVRLVLGANHRSLTADVALAALSAAQTGTSEGSGLRIVSYGSHTLFHPKIVHIERSDASRTAYVGSANFTLAATSGRNVEIGVVLDTRLGDAAQVIDQLAASTDRWFTDPVPAGVEAVSSHAQIVGLMERGVLGSPGAASHPSSNETSTPVPTQGPTRPPMWLPADSARTARPKSRGPSPASETTPLSWWKVLSPSDAQHPPNPGTNPTGKLRLSKSGLAIDPKTFFRDELLGGLPWELERRGQRLYERTTVSARVTIGHEELGTLEFLVDHAPHRVADQANIPTVLAWGPLSKRLREHDHTGDTVVISRTSDGGFELSIQSEPPESE